MPRTWVRPKTVHVPRNDGMHGWYSKLHPTNVDIVGDYAGHELFVVHGDSLVRHCLTQGVDLDGEGFQLLHAVWEAESFLAHLRRRKCNFHVVFFRSHAGLCVPAHLADEDAYKALLVRTVLVEHLRKTADETAVTAIEFDSPDDKAFAEGYLRENAVQFFMCHDGDPTPPRGVPSIVEEERETVAVTEHALWFWSFMYGLFSRGLNVGFMREAIFDGSKIFVPIASIFYTELPKLSLAVPPVPDRAHPETGEAFLEKTWIGLSNEAGIATTRDLILAAALADYGAAADSASPSLSSEDGERCAVALILHNIILRCCPLAQRACRRLDDEAAAAPETIALGAAFLADVCGLAERFLAGVSRAELRRDIGWDAYDLVDGRIFFDVLRRVAAKTPFPQEIARDAERLVELVFPDATPASWQEIEFVAVEPDAAVDDRPDPTILPFSHPVTDEFLRHIKLARAPEPQSAGVSNAIFQELTHWHNHKRLLKPHIPKAPGFFARQRKQKHMNDIRMYAASLTNAAGHVLDPEIVITGSSSAPTPSGKPVHDATGAGPSDQKAAPAKNNKGKTPPANVRKKPGGRRAALDAAKTQADQKFQAKEQSIISGWAETCRVLELEESSVQRYLKAAKFLNSLRGEKRTVIGPSVHLYMCNVLVSRWTRGGVSVRGKDLSLVGMAWYHILESAASPGITREVVDGVKSLTALLGLPAPRMQSTPGRPQPLGFSLATQIPRLPWASLDFQLGYAGPYLERSFDPLPDPRVPFAPDAWQRRVLDAIDRDRSLFVVAPTSAGKTFISFYAMKKVLQNDDDGVLVYVAPTKALVNQIAAEITARFSKSYFKPGRCLWALKTRDYTINAPENAQILITVPHVLQIMLLSGPNASRPSSWSRRVRRIVFDEVHCIGQADDGVVWEQLLLMAPCPVIALSATVGNAGAFGDWLAGAQSVRGHELETVTHDVRYSDLRKFIYREPPESAAAEFAGLRKAAAIPIPALDEGENVSERFIFVHPVAALTDLKRGNLDDIALEPRDAVTLWRVMKKHQTAAFALDPSLDPDKCLPAIVTKSDFVSWETRLKTVLCSWMGDGDSPFRTVRSALRGDDPDRPRSAGGRGWTAGSGHGLFSLLCDLYAQDAFPALVFNYDRGLCETYARKVVDHLEKAEETWKKASPEWQKTMRRFAEWEKTRAAGAEKKSRTSTVAAGAAEGERNMSKMERTREEASVEASKWESFSPDAPLEPFSFADSKKIPPSVYNETIGGLREEHLPPWLLNALQRGIGVHHAGMNRRYRSVVEILFRRGYLRVVIATGTLALGINMPCKTVIFEGDSVFLTALNFRQASGRAGRRGFDLLGNVVFHGILPGRVYEIMSSRLPDLNGSFALSTTLVLRMFLLMSDTGCGEYASTVVRAMLCQTRLYLGGPDAAESIRHHLRFSIEYLRRQHLLSARGVPLNFAGVVTHLYYTENASFALHALLKAGYFHDLCADIDERPKSVLLDIVLVLSHLFGRRPVLQTDRHYLEEVVRRSPSVVFLPRLPAKAEEVLLRHNADTQELFYDYIRSYAAANLAGEPDRVLPFTRRTVGGDGAGQVDAGTVPRSFSSASPPSTIRSPFVALSGHDDHSFGTIKELCRTVRGGVFLEESTVPYVPVWPHDDPRPLNAYAYDFFKNGSMEVLVRDNRIREGDVWFLLRDFSSVLATIETGLKSFVTAEGVGGDDDDDGPEEGEVPKGEDETAAGAFRAELHLEMASLAVREHEGGSRQKQKKKDKPEVADNWDDSSDGGEDEETGESGAPESSSAAGNPPSSWQQDGRGSLLKVVQAFSMVREEFETKFREVWS